MLGRQEKDRRRRGEGESALAGAQPGSWRDSGSGAPAPLGSHGDPHSEKQRWGGESVWHQALGSSDLVHLGRQNRNILGKERSLFQHQGQWLHTKALGCSGHWPTRPAEALREPPTLGRTLGREPHWGWSVCLGKRRDRTSLHHFHFRCTEGTLPTTCRSARSALFCWDPSERTS